MANRYKDGAIKKSAYIGFDTTQSQYDAIKAEAKSLGILPSEYLRRLVNNRNVVINRNFVLDSASVLAASRELSRIGNNINQIAHWYNKWAIPDNDMEARLRELLTECIKVTDKLHAAADGVTNGRR